ncbi:MAG: autotransporter-associated beta strand repeat-containing protein [Luteolibacter sp.]
MKQTHPLPHPASGTPLEPFGDSPSPPDGISRACRILFASLITLAAFNPFAGHAAQLQGQTSDTEIREDGSISAVTGTILQPGGSGTPALDRSAVYVFQLPDLGAVANPFTTAKFQFNVSSKTGTAPTVDLYGLGRRASSAVLASDYYGETTTADPTDATLLQNNILTSATPNGLAATNSAGNTALNTYLNAQYASGAGAGQYVFLRLSTETATTGPNRFNLGSADNATGKPQIIYNLPSGFTRPFIWVRDSEKADILAKIAANPWATSVYNGMVSRVAADIASHQANRDTFLRALPIVDWAAATPKFKTIPAFAESTVRFPAEGKYNDALDCAVLFYLTGNTNYARCAADILHNAVKTLLLVAASTSTGNGGWIFQSDLLKEARVTGTQLPIIYDFLYSWLQNNQVYDVKAAGMVNFNFTTAQSVFRKQYELTRDHGQKESNWSALMATMMLNNLLALDNATERNTALQIYLTTGTSKQASLSYDYRHYTQAGSIWPESLQYSGAVGSIRSTHMVLLERVDPSLNLFNTYPNFPLSLPRISYLRYPNGEQVMFGDGHRAGSNGSFFSYEIVYQHALSRGRTDLTSFFGSLINGGVADGNYNRSTLSNYATLGNQYEPLQLLWQAASLSEPAVTPALPRTDKLPHAGITLQRNPAPSSNSTYGLMGFVGGAAHIHSHSSGMSMELFGMGEVLGAKSGTESYGSTINENFYRVFASNNTIIVNGASRGEGGWGGFGINTVQTTAMEPQPFANAVSPDYSFSTSSFADDKGTLAEGTQQRTLAIVRTSPTTGYYVDVFRSRSTVTNRTVTTLNGNQTNQYHDYIYRNIGENSVNLRADGVPLPLTSQPNRFQNDIGDANDQPGWRYFTNTTVSFPTSASIRAQFVATVSGTPRYMDLHMPAVASREYAKVDSPAILEAPSPYHTRVAPTLVVRQIGEAWNKAFATVYEPHFGSTGGTVQNVTQLLRGGVVVGVKVESSVGLKNVVHYVLSNPAAGETYTDATVGLSFTGRFGIAADNGDGSTTLYLGDGSSLAYRGNSVATVSGAASQAEVRFTPGQSPVVVSNTPVDAVIAPPPPGFTWVPTAGGTGYDWTDTANWNPATVPNTAGGIAYKNLDLTGDQTVNVNVPVTLGEMVVGDSGGGESTLLQKGTNGSFIMDQTENGVAYLTRTAGGNGTVTFKDDLDITLIDNVTVRQAGGTAPSTLIIAGTVAGSGKSLSKEGSTLTLSLAGANTYSGATRIQGGILSLDQNLALQNSVLDTMNSITGDATNGLRTTVTSLTLGGLTGSINLASMFTSTSGGFSGVTALTLKPETGATLAYSGGIADGAAGMSLTKAGAGTQSLSGPNTYSGSTTISANSGTLEVGGAGNLGSGAYPASITIGNGSVFKYSSGAVQILSGSISGSGSLLKETGTATLTLSGSNTSFTGSVAIDSGVLTLGNTHALSAASALSLAGTSSLRASVQNPTINAPIHISGTPAIHAPDFGTGSATSTLTLGGAISGPGSLTLNSLSTVASNSNQTVRLNAPSTYTGSTAIHPADNDANLIVRLGINNALPATTVLSINGSSGGGSGRFARLEMNGFSQTIAGLQNIPANLRSQQISNAGAAVTLTIQNTTDHVFSGTIGGVTNLAKTGPGTQIIAGVNAMTGTTTVSEGKLLGGVGGSSASSSVILNNALGTFGASVTDNTKTWTCASLSSTAAGNLEFNFGPITPGTISPLTVTGLAAFTSTPAVRVVVDSPLSPGTYPLMTWGSTSGTPPSVVSVLNPGGTGGLADGTTASLAVSGNKLSLVIVGVPFSVKANNTNNLNLTGSWVGGLVPNSTSTAVWNNTVTTSNITVLGADATWAGISIANPGGAVTINSGNTLTLGANANDINMSSATANLTLNCPLTLGDANVWNVTGSRSLAINGVVSGTFPITKAGTGTAILSGINTFAAAIALPTNSGTLEIGGSGTLGSGTHAEAIEIGSGSTFRYNSSASQILTGPISGSGRLTKSASSALTLGGANPAFTGTVAIDAGTLNLGHTGALSAASEISIASGSTLTSQTTGMSIAVPITLGATATTSTISFGRNTSAQGSFSLNEAISGDGDLRLTTPGVSSGGLLQTIFLNSGNSYLGSTLITTGNSNTTMTVRANVADSLPLTTVLTLNGGAGSGSGRMITFDLNGYDQTLAGLTNTTGLTARNQRITNSLADRSTLTINNTSDFTFGGVGPTSSFNGNTVIPTAQITGNLELIKVGNGKFTLAAGAGNTFTGPTTLVEGILSLGYPTSLQNSPLDTLSSATGGSGNGLQTTVTALTLGGLIGDKNLTSLFTTTSGGYTGVTALTLNPANETTFEYSGAISDGAAGMSLTKTGLGTQILSGPNTYSGATTISAGTLALGASDVLPPTAVSIGTATLDAATFTDSVGTLDLTGPATIHLGTDGKIAFSASDLIDWSDGPVEGGTLTLTGTFVSGSSLRFGSTSTGLTSAQLARISATGLGAFALDADGFLTASPVIGFSSWITAVFGGGATVPAEQQGPNDDPDHDGISNLIEYAVAGHDPTVSNPSVGIFSSNILSFTKRPGTIGLTYAIQGSTDLGVTDLWTEVSPSPSYINDATTITHTLVPGTAPKIFLRLKVSAN